ncbi:hypothetical protein QGM71_11125 [Virgibacillus sp. C22-A2]|uniref:Uncharacterized protein n=1 Tax=Virgibacillus tibetensis TaxID=3042313 RepID=A0ABU6KFW4_9BACI|nr:hypothetical protein [Virgibacillus sp. C22-A2]
MGAKSLRVKYLDKWSRIIDINDISNWPLVKNGSWEKDIAKTFFMRFFCENGSEKAINIEIYN